MTASELLTYVFDDKPHALADQFADWITASPRFRAFALTYRDKIRKKIRGARDVEGFRDIQSELETAYLLLEERRFTVEYEKYGVGKQRGPDLSVTFKTRIIFNMEVTRMRAAGVDRLPPDRHYESNKLIDTVCGKLGQMLPSMINILVVVAEGEPIDDVDVVATMTRLRERMERKESDFFTRKGFSDIRDFLKQYQRLSGVLIHSTRDHETGKGIVLWANIQAKHPIPADVRAILQRLGTRG